MRLAAGSSLDPLPEEPALAAVLRGIERLDGSEEHVQLALQLLCLMLHRGLPSEALRIATTRQLFDEVFKGASYPSVVQRVCDLFDEFQDQRRSGAGVSRQRSSSLSSTSMRPTRSKMPS